MAALWLPSDDRHALALREPNLSVPFRWPVNAWEINRENPITRGLQFVFDPVTNKSVKAGPEIPVGDANRSSDSPPTTQRVTAYGPGFDWPGNLSLAWYKDPLDGFSTYDAFNETKITFLSVCATDVVTERRMIGFDRGATNTLFHLEHTSVWRFQVRNTSSSVINLTGPSVITGKPTCLVGTFDGPGGQMFLNVDGVESTDTAPTGTYGIYGIRVGGYNQTSQEFDGWLGIQAIWNRALSSSERASLVRNPYQILKPANSTPYLISVPTGGATTINADFISSVTSVYEPTLTTSAVTISADFVSAATSVYEPTVTAPSGAQDITADFISSATSVHEPTVTTGAVSIAADFISASTAVHEPTLTAGAVTIPADFVSAATSVYEPTVFSGLAIAPEFIAATTAVYEPTINTGAVTIAADLIAAGTIVYEPTVSSAVNISADFIASATSVYEPTVGIGAVTIQPDFISSGTIVYEPSIPFGQIISADFIAATSVVYEPFVTDASTIWTEISGASTTWTPLSATSTIWTEI